MTKSLKHFGVFGMKWGHRQNPERQAISDHKSKVKSLKSQIKAKEIQAWDKEQAWLTKNEKEAYARIDNLREKKVSEIRMSNANPIKKVFAKMIADTEHTNRTNNVVSKLEDQLIKADDKRLSTMRKEKKKLDNKYTVLADNYFHSVIKKLPFPMDIKASIKKDRELQRQQLEEALELKLKYATPNVGG